MDLTGDKRMKTIIKIIAVMGAAFLLSGCISDQVSNEYITISKYKGVEVDKVEGIADITDEAVENNIQKVIEGFAEITEVDRGAREGDIVVVDYICSVDGKEIESESVKDYKLELGSTGKYDGFQDTVIGHKKGDVYTVQHTYDAAYGNADIAGKDADIEITVKSVSEKELPDLTDDFVQKISQKSKTVDEYREEMREVLEEKNQEIIDKELKESAWKVVLENTEVHKYPEDMLEEDKQEFYKYYQAGADFYEMEFADFLKEQYDVTEEEFEETITKDAKNNVKEDLAVELISEKEKISLTDKEYEEAVEELAETMSYDSVDEMKEEATDEQIRRYIMRDQVMEWVAKHCIQVES